MHADPAGAPDGDDRVGDLEHQPGAVLDRAAVAVGPLVRAVLQELVEEIAVGAVDLDAVEAGGLGVLGALAIGGDHARNLVGLERARRRIGALGPDQADMALGRDGARRDRRKAVVIDRIGNPADVPELQEDAAARGVDGLGDRPPALDLLVRPDAGRARIADALRRDGGRLGEDEAGGGALDVIVAHQRIGDPARHGRAVAGQGRQEDAVRDPEVAEDERIEERGHGSQTPKGRGRDRAMTAKTESTTPSGEVVPALASHGLLKVIISITWVGSVRNAIGREGAESGAICGRS